MMALRRFLSHSGLLLLVLLVSSGCQLALIGAAGVALSGDGSSSGFVPQDSNSAPQVGLASFSSNRQPDSTLQTSFTTSDAEGDASDVEVEYSADGGNTWQPATNLSLDGQATTNPMTGLAPGTYNLEWDFTAGDLGPGAHTDVLLRLTPSDSQVGLEAETPTLTVGNDPPSVAFDAPGAGDLTSGLVQIDYTATDSTSDDIAIDVLYSAPKKQLSASSTVALVSDGPDTRTVTVTGLVAGTTMNEAIVLNGTTEVVGAIAFDEVTTITVGAGDPDRTIEIREGAGGSSLGDIPPTETGAWYVPTLTVGDFSGVSTSPGGTPKSLVWDTNVDLGSSNVNGVQLRISPEDTQAGATVTSPAFDVGNNDNPIAFIGSPIKRDVGEGPVTIFYFLLDGNSDPIDIVPEFSTDGAVWFPATEDTDSLLTEGTTGLTSSTNGTSHNFVWESGTDLAGIDSQTVRFRIRPSDPSGPGQEFVTDDFWINNNIEPESEIAKFSGIQEGDITVRYTLTDDESDTVNAAFIYSLDGGTTFAEMTPQGADPDHEGNFGLASSPDGVEHVFVWDSSADLGGADHSNVVAAMVASDHPTPELGEGEVDIEFLDVLNGSSNPGIETIETMDDNGDGIVDLLRVTFNKPVDDSTFDETKWRDLTNNLPEVAANPLANAEESDGPASEVDVADDAVIYINVDTALVPVDTAILPDIETDPDFIFDTDAGGPFGAFGVTSASLIEEDDVAPLMTGATTRDTNGDGRVDRLEIVFSESVDIADGLSSDGLPGYSVSGGFSIAANDYGATGTSVLRLDLSGGPIGTAVVPDVTYTAGNRTVQDAVGIEQRDADTETSADGSGPVVLSAAYDDSGTEEIFDDEILVTFSESIDTTTVDFAATTDFVATGNLNFGTDGEADATVPAATDQATILMGTAGNGATLPGAGDTLDLVTGGILDTSGNGSPANDVPVTVTGGAGPRVTAITTLDDDGDGRVDILKITFDQPVDDGTYDTDGSGASAGALTLTGTLVTPVSEPDTADDATIYAGIEEDTPNTGVTGDLTTVQAGFITSVDGLLAPIIDPDSVVEQDGAPPRLVSSETIDDSPVDGQIDGLALTFSEAIDVNDAGDGGDGLPDFDVSGRTITTANYDTTGVPSFILRIDASGSLDSDATPTVTYQTAGGTILETGGTLEVPAGDSVVSEDTAPPIMVSGVTADNDKNGHLDEVTLNYSEPIDVLDGNPSDALPGFNISGFTFGPADYSASGVTTLSLNLIEDTAFDTGTTPLTSYQQPAGSVLDAAGNEQLDLNAVIPDDGAGPVVGEAAYNQQDTPGDKTDDTVTLTFSEPVNDTSLGTATGDLTTSFALGSATLDTGGTGNDDTWILRLASDSVPPTVGADTVEAVTGEVEDTALLPSPSNPVPAVVTDGTPPFFQSAVTGDGDGNGRIDRIDVAFTETVTGDLLASDWTVSSPAYTVTGVVSVSSTTIRLQLSESGGDDTEETPSVSYAPGNLEDGNGNFVAGFGPNASTDGAPPVLRALSTFDDDGNGIVDILSARFSEPVQDGTWDPALSSDSVFTLTGGADPLRDAAGTVDGPVNVAGGMGDVANDETVYVQVNEAGTANTGSVGDFTTSAAGVVQDAAGNNALQVTSGGLSETDGAGPVIVSATYNDKDGTPDPENDVMTVRFSEPISDASLDAGGTGGDPSVDLEPTNFSFGNDSVTDTQGADDAVLLITMGTTGSGASEPNFGTDTLGIRTGQVSDGVGTVSPSWDQAETVELLTGPATLAITTLDSDADGDLDWVQIEFDRAVDDSTYDPSGVTVTGLTVDPGAAGSPLAGPGDGADDAFISLQVTSVADTGVVPDVTYPGGTIQELAGPNDPNIPVGSSFPETDGAAPIPLFGTAPPETVDEDQDGQLDGIKLTFSEPVTGSDITNGGSAWLIGASHTAVSGGTTSGNTATIAINEIRVDTAELPTIEYTGGNVTDTSSSQNPLATFGAQAPVDRAAPIAVTLETEDLDANGRIESVLVSYSEDVSGTGTDLDVPTRSSVSHSRPAANQVRVSFAEAGASDTDARPAVDSNPAGDLTDGAPGNEPPGFTGRLPEDKAPPVVVSRTTSDDDGDGQLDRIRLGFSEAVDIVDGNVSDGLPAYSVQSPVRAIVDDDYAATGTTSLDLFLVEAAFDTGDTPEVVYSAGSGTTLDGAWNEEPDNDGSGQPATDGARPILVESETVDANPTDGALDELLLTFSETVTVTDGGGAGDGLSGFSIDTHTQAPATYSGTSATLSLALQPNVGTDTDVRPIVTYSADGTITDGVGLEMPDGLSRTSADGTGPFLIQAATRDRNGDGEIDQIVLTYSEKIDVNDVGGASDGLPDYEVDAKGRTIVAKDYFPSSATVLQLDLVASGTPDTDATPTVEYGILGGTVTTTDIWGNEAPDQVVTALDESAPAFVRAETGDAVPNGQIDVLDVIFSESVTGTISGFTVGGYTIDTGASGISGSTVILALNESGSADSDATPSVTYDDTSGDIEDLASTPNVALSFGPETSLDKVGPIIIQAGYDRKGSIFDPSDDELRVVFSESIDDTTLDTTSGGADKDYGLSGTIAFGASSTGASGVNPDEAIVFMKAGSTPAEPGDEVFLQAGAISDTNGNLNTATNPSVLIDTDPYVTGVRTLDLDGNGKVDHYEITFNEPVDDSTYDPVADPRDVTNDAFTINDGALATPAVDTADDAIIFLSIAEDQGINSGKTGDLIFDAGLIQSLSIGRDSEALTAGAIAEADGVQPLAVEAFTGDFDGDGFIDVVEIGFSEPVNIIDGNAADGLPGFSVTGYTIVPTDYVASGTTSLVLFLVEGGTADTDASPETSYTPPASSSVDDLSGNPLAAGSDNAQDNAGPVIISAEYDTKGTEDVSDDVLDVIFSEAIADSTLDQTVGGTAVDFGNPVASGALNFGTDSTSSTGAVVDDNLVTISMGSSATPPDFAMDKVRILTAAIEDALGLPASDANQGAALIDISPLSPTGIQTRDLDLNGRVDALEVTYNKNVDEATYQPSFASTDGTLILDTVIGLRDPAGNGAQDATIFIAIQEAAQANTGTVTDLTASAGLIQSTGGENSKELFSGDITEADGAAPILLGGTLLTRDGSGGGPNGRIDRIAFSVSEDLDDATLATAGFTVAGYSISSLIETAPGDVEINLVESGSLDTGNRPDVTYDDTAAGADLADPAGNLLPGFGPTQPADGALPLVALAELRDGDLNGHLDSADILFSEPIVDATLNPAGFELANSPGVGVDTLSFSNDQWLRIAFEPVRGTGPRNVTYSATTGQLDDPSGNPVPSFGTSPAIEQDLAAPVLLGATYADDGDGILGGSDELILTFSEEVTVNSPTLADFNLLVTNDLFGTGASVAAGPDPTDVTITLGTGPVFRVRFEYTVGADAAGDPSGIEVDANIPADAIEDASGNDVMTAQPRDIGADFTLVQAFSTSDSAVMELGDIDGDGDLDLIEGVVGGQNNIWRNSGGVLSGPTGFGNSNFTSHLDFGDYDQDGDLDLAVGNGLDTQLTSTEIYENDGSGNFSLSQTLLQGNARGVEMVDMNRDGKLDLVEANGATNGVRIYPGRGTGFDDKNTVDLTGDNNGAIAIADFDLDGDPDIVAGIRNTGQLRLWRNDGSLTFTDTGPFGPKGDTRNLATGDLDGDGVPDLVIGHQKEPNQVLFGKGDGTFTNSGQLLGRDDTWDVSLVDQDGDGDLDLLMAEAGLGVFLYENDGTGGLAFTGNLTGFGVGDASLAAETGDVDGDGDPDLLVGRGNGQANTMVYNQYDAWRRSSPTPVMASPFSGDTLFSSFAGAVNGVAIADLDQDGDPDIVAGIGGGGNDSELMENAGDGTFSSVFGLTGDTGVDVEEAQVGDLDGDGDLDIVFGASGGNGGLRIHFNSGSGPLSGRFSGLPDKVLDSGKNNISLRLVDVDLDADLDIVAGRGATGTVYVWRNDGSANFTIVASDQLATSGNVQGVAVRDVDGDGHPDIVSNESGFVGSRQTYWENSGGSFPTDDIIDTRAVSRGAECLLADFNRDGVREAAFALGPLNQVGVYEYSPSFGTWSALAATPSKSGPHVGLGSGDLDQDGDLDLVVGQDTGAADDYVLLNDGKANFSDPGLTLGSDGLVARAVDLDGDGDLDVIYGSAASLRIYRNDLE